MSVVSIHFDIAVCTCFATEVITLIVNKISSHRRWNRGLNYSHEYVTDADAEKLWVLNHTHDVLQITFFEEIDADFFIDGQTIKIHNNDIFIIKPETVHEIQFHDTSTYKRYCIWMRYEFVPERLRANLFDTGNFIQRSSNSVTDAIFHKLDYYSAVFDDDTFENLLKWLSFEIIYNIKYVPKERVAQKVNHSTAESVLSYVNNNLFSIRTIEDICQNVHISKRYLHIIFRQLCNITPMEYIRKMRLTLAREELQRGEKVLDVCMKCGFSSYSSFYRSYKNNFGYSPSDEPIIICNEFTKMVDKAKK